MSDHASHRLVETLSSLYELSLSIGGSLDVEVVCSRFLEALLARKSFAFAAVFRTDDSPECLYSNPARRVGHRLPSNELFDRFGGQAGSHCTLNADDLELLLEEPQGLLSGTAFALGPRAFFVVGSSRAKCLDAVERAQLSALVERFAIAIDGCLAHREQQRTKDLLLQQADELQLAREHAERASAAKSRFLAQVSHELRTPLTSVIGYAELMQNSTPEEFVSTGRNYTERVLGSARHLMQLIEDVLDLSGIESGRLHVAESPVAIRAFCESAMRDIEPAIRRKGLGSEFAFDARLPEQLLLDEKRVGQVLRNLLSNAVKYTTAGKISLQVDRLGDSVRLTVSDTGCGIGADDRERVFSAFERVGHAQSMADGTGLGLTIAREVAELLGGSLSLESEVGQGSTFTLSLPLRETSRAPSRPRSNTVAPPDLSAKRLLVAEDTEDVRMLIELLLKPTAANVVYVTDGSLAVERCLDARQLGAPFDIVLMDIQMPNMDGIEAVRALRKEGVREPILAMTAYAQEEDIERTRAAGFDAHLSKPILRDKLYAALSDFLPV